MIDKLLAFGALQTEDSFWTNLAILIEKRHVVRVVLIDEAVVPALKESRMLRIEGVVGEGSEGGSQWHGDHRHS